ncbi:MAG: hypothetical protein Q9166_006436 [cf. Caloplaca sp. 2 TL-2023]
MPPHEKDFMDRCPRPKYDDESAYSAAREDLYPGRGRIGGGYGFPPPSMTAGFDAEARWKRVKDEEKLHQQARDAYDTRVTESWNALESMDEQERRYYRRHTGGATPTDHADLKPKARTHADTAYEHAHQRECLYGGAPMLYDNAKSQTQHHGYAARHYGESDRAEANYDHHANWEHDPSSDARDAYDRPVPHGRKPMVQPYPYRDPALGYYSAEYGETYEKTGKKARKQKGRDRS